MKKHKKDKIDKKSTVVNRIVFAAIAGAMTGLAVTYLLESGKGRSLLAQAGSSLKSFAGNIKLPSLLRA